VEKNGSAYFPLASSAASTVERADAGTHPEVLNPGLETALSSLTLADDWMRKPGTAAESPAFAGAFAAGGGAACGGAARAAPAAVASAAAAVTASTPTRTPGRDVRSIAGPPHY